MKQIDFDEHWNDSEKIFKFPKIGTNQAQILLMLLDGHHATNRQMGTKLDSVSTGARISELRSFNWPIEATRIPYRTKEGKDVSYCEYYLDHLQELHRDPRVQKFVESQRKR